jgi:hypothetical protein
MGLKFYLEIKVRETMVFFNVLSKLSLVDISSPEGIIQHNRLILIIGLTLYGVIGALIYYKKFPIKGEKYQKYLTPINVVIAALVDLGLYFALHKVQYGMFPPLTMSMVETAQQPPPVRQGGGGQGPSKSVPPTQQIDPKVVQKRPTVKQHREIPDDISISSEVTHQLDDELSNSLKIRGQTQQHFQPPAAPIDDDDEDDDDEPKEISLADKDYFKEDASEAVVENWDTEDFTHQEYVPDE